MTEYRNTLYKNYFKNQAGRRINNNTFQKEIDFQEFVYQKEIIPLLKHLPKNAKILDVGCGYGALINTLLKQQYTQVTGIDISPEQIQIAKNQLKLAKYVQVSEAHNFLEQQKQQFDVIIALDLIEHFNKTELVQFLQLITQSLTPNGMLICRTPNADALYASPYAAGDYTHETILNASSAIQVFEGCAYTHVQVFSSCIDIYPHFFKNKIRQILWLFVQICAKILLFATGRSSKNIIFTPNIIIKATI